MRKAVALVLAFTMALSLFACGQKPEQNDVPNSDIQQGTVILPKPPDDTDNNQDGQNGEYPSAQDPLPNQPGSNTQKPQEDKKDDTKTPETDGNDNSKPAEDPKQEETGGDSSKTETPSEKTSFIADARHRSLRLRGYPCREGTDNFSRIRGSRRVPCHCR